MTEQSKTTLFKQALGDLFAQVIKDATSWHADVAKGRSDEQRLKHLLQHPSFLSLSKLGIKPVIKKRGNDVWIHGDDSRLNSIESLGAAVKDGGYVLGNSKFWPGSGNYFSQRGTTTIENPKEIAAAIVQQWRKSLTPEIAAELNGRFGEQLRSDSWFTRAVNRMFTNTNEA
jgi:hypothetical protein